MLSYATDKTIVVWKISVRVSSTDNAEHKIELRALLQVDMVDPPLDMVLLGSVLILATPRHMMTYRYLKKCCVSNKNSL